jgi:hypothetical protein
MYGLLSVKEAIPTYHKQVAGSIDLSRISQPSSNPRERLRQMQAMAKAHDALAASAPELPDPDSLVPIVLAMDDLKRSISDAKTAVESSLGQLQSLENQVRSDEASLTDADAVAGAIESRMAKLQTAQDERVSKPPEDLARDMLRTKQQRKKLYKTESKNIRKALEKFIQDHLGAMIAAEELGGPVAGELDGIDQDVLSAGFSTQGRPVNTKDVNRATSAAKRQQRLDEIWGAQSGNAPTTEQQAACEQLSTLMDDLIMALSGSSESGIYVELERDSAAARFLVRAKVAQYHPKDARKLRLIDFGRELDD